MTGEFERSVEEEIKADGSAAALQRALDDAIALIESYRADIRERGLDREGFCQGSAYAEGYERLKRIRDGTPTGRCRDCRHWKEAQALPGNMVEAYGTCEWFTEAPFISPESLGSEIHGPTCEEDGLAGLSAPAQVVTHADFGCVQFEPREDESA